MKTLVVYFSRSGNTRHLAQAIAKRSGADVDEILESRSRAGLLGYLVSVWQALRRATPPVLPPRVDPAAYDLVVVGTPVWVQRLSPPLRSYLAQHARAFKQVAFFCTLGGNGEREAFAEMSALCAREPVATIAVTEREIAGLDHSSALAGYASALQANAPRAEKVRPRAA